MTVNKKDLRPILDAQECFLAPKRRCILVDRMGILRGQAKGFGVLGRRPSTKFQIRKMNTRKGIGIMASDITLLTPKRPSRNLHKKASLCPRYLSSPGTFQLQY